MSLTKEQIIDCLRHVEDPVSLNMVKNVAVCDGHVRIHIELTTPACPLKNQIREDVEHAISRLTGVKRVEVEFSAQTRRDAMERVNLPEVRNIIAIGAGKGGVGKSTVSVLVATGLARAGAKVGLLDADVYGPSIPKMLGIENTRPGLAPNNIMLPVIARDLKVMSVGFLIGPQDAVIWRGPMIHGVIRQFLEQVDWGELDYLIVDLPPGTGDVPLTLSQSIPLTGAVIVCTPQEIALLDAVRAMRMYQQLNIDILGLVENMSYFVAPDTGKEYDLFGKGGVERTAAQLNVPFLGSIPINVAIRTSGDNGNINALFGKDHQGVSQTITRMVEKLAGQISMRNAARKSLFKLNVVQPGM